MRKTPESSATIEAKQSDARLASTRGTSRARNMQRRRGQTLLIAVLLMIFAALLGATFITVVALNLNQTTRGTNRAEAQTAATAGVSYVNDQISYGIDGTAWRPTIGQTLTPGSVEYDEYYSAFEQAQGWASAGYVKYPNPLAVTSALRNSPTFLAKVKDIRAVDNDPEAGEREGQLRLDIIGRSADNDAVFARRIAYKPTSENGGPGAFARYDSNFDFGGKRVIQTKAQLATATTLSADQTISVADVAGFTRGRLAMVATTTGTFAATIAGVSTGMNQIQLRFATPVSIDNGAVVRAASPLTGNFVNGSDARYSPTRKFDSTGAGAVANATLANSTNTVAPEQNGLGGIFINGGLALINQIQLKLRDGGANAVNTDKVQVAGVLARDQNTTSNDYTTSDITKVNVVDSVTGNPISSYDFPANGNTSALVNDNSAAEAGDPTADVVRPLTPGRIDGANSRYLKLTRGSGDVGAEFGYGRGVYIDNADDVEKVGRLINNTTPDFRALNVSETQRLWARKSFPVRADEQGNTVNAGQAGPYYRNTVVANSNNGHRLSWPNPAASPTSAPGVDANYYPSVPPATPSPAAPTPVPVSLEERSVRGWVSPWEYKPRGVLIELQGNEIIITRDDRSNGGEDGVTGGFYSNDVNTYISNPTKAWKDSTGNFIGGGKKYRMRINITTAPNSITVQRHVGAPGADTLVATDSNFSGVIYAEGNVRVRGFLNTSIPDVTIVSMNNIYVEGSIRRNVTTDNDGHVALLARNNVVLNPTLFLAQPAELTDSDIESSPAARALRVTSNPAVNDRQFTVDTNGVSTSPLDVLRVGAAVRIGTGQEVYIVTRVDTPNQVTLNTGLITAVTAGARVRLVYENPTQLAKGEYSRKLDGTVDSMGRIFSPGRRDDNNLYRFVFRHGAAKKPAFSLRRENALDGTLNIKEDTNTNFNTENVEKLFQVGTNPPNAPYDLLQINGTYTLGDDSQNTLGALANEVNSIGAATPPGDWEMTTSEPNIAARHIPRFNTTVPASSTVEVPLLASMLFSTSVGNGARETLSFGADRNNPSATENFATSLISMMNPMDLRFYQKSEADPTEAGMFWMSQPRVALAGNWDASSNPVVLSLPDQRFPSYFLGPVKLERSGGDFLTPTANFAPGTDIEVDAQVYAQNGSWFVIPMPTLEPKIDTTSAAYVAMTPAERQAALAASTRFRRLNYNIDVIGTISQNFAPPLVDYDAEVDPDGVATGPQQRWIDSLAYPTQVAASVGSNYGTNWTTIQYTGQKLPIGNTLKMPVSPDLLYVN